MTSSGMKRGLAATAVSALAVTGLPFLTAPASAKSLEEQMDATAVALMLNDDAPVSIKHDGQNDKVSLVAKAGSEVDKVVFTYTVDGGTPEVIATVTRDANGAFTHEWAPPVSIYNKTITIKAEGQKVSDSVVNNDAAQRVLVSTSAESIELTPANEVGFFVQPGSMVGKMIVAGTTSALTGNITLMGMTGVPVTVTPPAAKQGDTSRAFAGVVDVDAAKVSDTAAGSKNQVMVDAQAGDGGSTDAQAFNVYKQEIKGIAAVAKSAKVPAGSATDVVVTVTDQKGKPIAGATVGSVGANAGTATPAVTDAKGQATFKGAKEGTWKYYVDTTDKAGYDSGIDYATDVTIGKYDPTPNAITFAAKDGLAAFDYDELKAGDLTVEVKDQEGNPVSGRSFFYSWDYTPFAPNTKVGEEDKAQSYSMPPVDVNAGKATVVLPDYATGKSFNGRKGGTFVLKGFINMDNTPGQSDGDLVLAPQTLKVGESQIVWSDASPAQRAAGTVQTFTGKLVLADGSTVLGGRDLTIGWSRDALAVGSNAVLAAQADQPAGTKRVSDLAATVKTAADGTFGVAVLDPATAKAEDQKDELGGKLEAKGTDAGVGNDAVKKLTVDFLKNAAPASIALVAGYDKNDPAKLDDDDAFDELIGDKATPGRPVTFQLKVTNAADGKGTALANQAIALSTDHGFFTDAAEKAGDLVASPAAAQGGEAGWWKDNGETTVIKTDDKGIALVTLAIGRDAGFDDDGKVTSLVTAKIGSVSNESPISVEWTSADAYNPKSVELVQVADLSIELPEVRTDKTVGFNVFAKDQFGNLTQDEVAVENLGKAKLAGADNGKVMSQFSGSRAALTASSEDAAEQTIKATWTQASHKFDDAVTDVAADESTKGFQAKDAAGNYNIKPVDAKKSDTTDTIEWYAMDAEASSYVLSHNGSDKVTVGSAVTEIVTVKDQNGAAVDGVWVQFIRTGPGNGQDSDGNFVTKTNRKGEAFYTFAGGSEGYATIVAVVYKGDPRNGGERLGETNTEVLEFVAKEQPVVRKAIAAKLEVADKRNGDDVVFVKTGESDAAGAVVKLYKVRKNGTKKLVAEKIANAAGNARFVVEDRNTRRATKYRAEVGETEFTFADWSNGGRIS